MAHKEQKYFVLKLDDLHEYLTPEGRASLDEIANYISAMRKQYGREPHPQYIVCNQDEPYAAAVWDVILSGEDSKGQGETQHCTQAEELRVRNAMLVTDGDAYLAVEDLWRAGYNISDQEWRDKQNKFRQSLSATQKDADAFVAEHDARVLEEAADAWESEEVTQPKDLRKWAAELRASATQPEGKEANHCRRCGGKMKPGIATMETYTGTPDFPGTKECVTLVPGGPGFTGTCMKCEKCGWSVEGKGTGK